MSTISEKIADAEELPKLRTNKSSRKKKKSRKRSTLRNSFPEQRFNSPNNRTQQNFSPNFVRDVVCYGDKVIFESQEYPGYYLRLFNGSLHLTKRKRTRFTIRSPPGYLAVKNMNDNSFHLSLKRIPINDEALQIPHIVLTLIRALPFDVMLHILKFLPKWTHLARMMYRPWHKIAHKNILRIKILARYEDIIDMNDKDRVFSLITSCPNLIEVSIRNCRILVDKDFRRLTTDNICKNKKLRIMSFGGCRELGDNCIHFLAKLPSLDTLNLARSKITDKGLILITQKLPLLKNLNFYGCELITPSGAQYLISKLRFLEEINLRGTKIQHLPRRFLNLKVDVLLGHAEIEGIYL